MRSKRDPMRWLTIGAALVAVAGLAPVAAQASETKPKVEKTDPATLKAKGEARNCISNRSVTTKIVGDKVIMFREGASRWYRNDLRNSCPSLRDDSTLVFRNIVGSQYCDMDMFKVVDTMSHTTYGTCSLGKFTPVEVPKGTKF